MPLKKSGRSDSRRGAKLGRHRRKDPGGTVRLAGGLLMIGVCLVALSARFLPRDFWHSSAASTGVQHVPGSRGDPTKGSRQTAESPKKPGISPGASRPAGAQTRDAEARADRPAVFNSPWNGSVWQVERYLKRTLHDASSFEAIAWGPVTTSGQGYRVWCRFKAKNVLGVFTTQTRTFFLNRHGEILAVKD